MSDKRKARPGRHEAGGETVGKTDASVPRDLDLLATVAAKFEVLAENDPVLARHRRMLAELDPVRRRVLYLFLADMYLSFGGRP